MEDNMQAVGNVLGNLKNMAADMGGEIDRQNKQLDKIDVKVTYYDFKTQMLISAFQAAGADVKIGVANKRTEKILKS